MNTFDSPATTPTGPGNVGQVKEILSRSSNDADSALSSSAGSSRSRSSFGSRKRGGNQQTQQPLFNESTNLFNAPGSSARNYQATETPAPPYGLRDEPRNVTADQPAPSNGVNQANGNGNGNGSCNCNCNCNSQSQPPQTPYEPEQTWKSRFIDRFGAMELENKGSVARDHLALGMPPNSIEPKVDNILTKTRTNVPRLDAHISRLRLNRHSSYPTLPSE